MLKRFFQDLEAVFAAHNIIDLDERIGDVKHYAEPQEEEVFDAVVLPAGATWDDFKRKALEMYPGAEDDFRYSHEDLAAVATAFRVAGRVSKESIGMYYRDYSKIAHFLISKQRAHEPEVRRQFLEGFPEAAKSDITLTLRAKFPTATGWEGTTFERSSARRCSLSPREAQQRSKERHPQPRCR